MEEHGIVPDLIPVAPTEIAEVKYRDITLNPGDELTPTQVKDPPTTIKWTSEPDTYYTLILSDPDIPEQFNIKQFHHWLMVNIPGNDLSEGDTIFDYIGSGPPKESGLHRYVFLIYKQPGKLEKTVLDYIFDNCMEDRGKYLVADIVNNHSLGDPVAGNFFKAEYDEYVPKIHQFISEKYEKIKEALQDAN